MYYDKQGNSVTLREWSDLFEDTEYRRVAQDTIGLYWISTVFLGLDHSWGEGKPVLFETMVFAPDDEELGPELDMRRYCTEQEALQGHAELVTLLHATVDTSGPVSEQVYPT